MGAPSGRKPARPAHCAGRGHPCGCPHHHGGGGKRAARLARRQIGTIDDLREDARGLRIIAACAGAQVRVGQGLSFGYRVRRAHRSAWGAYRELTQLDLIEISLVAQPMQPLARVLATDAPFSTEETDHGL